MARLTLALTHGTGWYISRGTFHEHHVTFRYISNGLPAVLLTHAALIILGIFHHPRVRWPLMLLLPYLLLHRHGRFMAQSVITSRCVQLRAAQRVALSVAHAATAEHLRRPASVWCEWATSRGQTAPHFPRTVLVWHEVQGLSGRSVGCQRSRGTFLQPVAPKGRA